MFSYIVRNSTVMLLQRRCVTLPCFLCVLVSKLITGDANPDQCCGTAFGGTCADGTHGTPCCGTGGCNVFCCNCDGGCRAWNPPHPPAPPSAKSTPLNEWPMIITHDSGTSYYDDSGSTCSVIHPVNNYVITQGQRFFKQLECGARALDLRLYVEDGTLVMHHGSVAINVKLHDALLEVTSWAKQNPDELVMLYGSHCDGKSDSDKSSCASKYDSVLGSMGIKRIDCGDIQGLTLGGAMDSGKLGTGGSVLAVYGCVSENWDDDVKCYDAVTKDGADPVIALRSAAEKDESLRPALELVLQKYGNRSIPEESRVTSGAEHPEATLCWGSESDKAFNKLWSYMSAHCDTATAPCHGLGRLCMAQAIWNADAAQIAQGILHLSCILDDESKSGLNSKLAAKISSGTFKHINLLEVNNVCDHGPDILQALRGRFTYDVSVDVSLVV